MSPKRPGRRPSKRRPLTDQQERFCLEFVRAPSAAQAAIRAGYAAGSAKQSAHQLLHGTGGRAPMSAKIRARVAKLVAELEAAQGVTQARLENELAAVAFADLRDLVEFGPDGIVVRSSADIPAESAAALVEIRCEERVEEEKSKVLSGAEAGEQIQVQTTILHRRMGVKLHPKLQAIEILARLRKFIKPSNPFGGDGEGGTIIPVPVLLPAVRDA
jgi:phage terminase small subunit